MPKNVQLCNLYNHIQEKSFFSSSSIVLILGLGSLIGWGMIQMSPSIFPLSSPSKSSCTTAYYFVERGLSMIILLSFALASLRSKELSEKKIVQLSSSLMLIGTALQFHFDFDSEQYIALSFLALCLCSPSVILSVLWGKYVCLMKGKRGIFAITVSFFFAFGISLTASFLHSSIAHILYSILPIISGRLLNIVRRENCYKTAYTSRKQHIPYRFFIGVLVFGIVFTTINTFSEAKSNAPDEFTTLIAGFIASAMISLLVKISPQNMNFTLAFRWILPLLLLMVFIVLGAEEGQQGYEVFTIGFSWVYFQVFTWVMWRAIAVRSTFRPECIFAIGNLFLSAALFLSSLLDWLISLIKAPIWATAALICILASCASMFLLSDQYILKLVTSKAYNSSDLDKNSRRACVISAGQNFRLTQREQTIAENVLAGYSNEEIQNKLFIANGTLRTHLRNIYKKSGVHSRTELITTLMDFME